MDIREMVYLDYAATTPLDTRVLEAMMPYFANDFGNPSSVHRFGQRAEAAVENAREQIADFLNAEPGEIVFTSCGSESDNLAIRGIAYSCKKKGCSHLLVSPVEHPAVLQTARQLAEIEDFLLELLPVNEFGQVDPDDVRHAIRSNTALVSVMYANNEIGSINPVKAVGEICREKGVYFHSDAVQAAAHIPMDVQRDKIDLLSLGAHKFYGPKGVGALYIRSGTPILSAQTGGGQEFNLRAGTHNVPYIVGFAEALRISLTEMKGRNEDFIKLRNYLIDGVLELIPRVRLTGHATQRLPNHASFVFEGVDGNALLMLLDQAGFACSSGSACKSGNPKPSEVLTALGFSRSWSLGSLRVTLGKTTTFENINSFLHILPELIQKIRSSSVRN